MGIVKHVLNQFEDVCFSISATSRSPRGSEVNGKDYYFFNVEDFKQLIQDNKLLEYQEVYPNQFYGTLKFDVEKIWSEGKVVIFDVDVLGAINLKKALGNSCRTFFVKAPSIEVIEKRLRSRNTETEERIQLRLSKVEEELTYQNQFDYIIINDNLDLALKESENLVNQFIK